MFILPSLLGFGVFVFLAVVASFGISFLDWGLTGPRGFVAIDNYRQLLRDPVFWKAFRNTAFYIVTIVPLQLALGLTIAVALNQAIRARSAFRMIYFLPVVTTIVAGAIVFRLILAKNGPLANLVGDAGGLLGLPLRLPDLLGSTRYSKWSVVLLTLWKNTGFTMVVYLAALQGVPQELYDAAHVDGAGPWQRFRNVTWPMITDDFLSRHSPDHRRVPALYRTLRHDPRRPRAVVHAGRPIHLRQRLPLHAHGQSIGDRLVPIHLHLRFYAGAECDAAAMGAL